MRFEADLVIDQGNRQVVVTGDDGTLVITGDRLGTMFGALRSGGGMPRGGLRHVSDRLADAGATIRLETPSAQVLTMGEGARPQLVTRLVGAPHLRFESARGLLGSLPPAALASTLIMVGTAVVTVGWMMYTKRA